ncbi:MAG: nuclear transport factor 2 family protein [Paracoccus sp. (in: a-proteobacteria)]|nr:nuclear transport factor 2 family protein [Paracoccus sp. (in: a-proteobacteria)]
MYHTIVRRRIRSLFDAVNRGDARPVLDTFTPDGEHVFNGAHAMSGRRVTAQGRADWYARLFRLLPDIRFILHRIDVAGPPWATIAVVEWSETNSATDGIRTGAAGVHVVHLKWGRMTRLLILTDTAALQATLSRTAETSRGESLAPPIDERPGWPAP